MSERRGRERRRAAARLCVAPTRRPQQAGHAVRVLRERLRRCLWARRRRRLPHGQPRALLAPRLHRPRSQPPHRLVRVGRRSRAEVPGRGHNHHAALSGMQRVRIADSSRSSACEPRARGNDDQQCLWHLTRPLPTSRDLRTVGTVLGRPASAARLLQVCAWSPTYDTYRMYVTMYGQPLGGPRATNLRSIRMVRTVWTVPGLWTVPGPPLRTASSENGRPPRRKNFAPRGPPDQCRLASRR